MACHIIILQVTVIDPTALRPKITNYKDVEIYFNDLIAKITTIVFKNSEKSQQIENIDFDRFLSCDYESNNKTMHEICEKQKFDNEIVVYNNTNLTLMLMKCIYHRYSNPDLLPTTNQSIITDCSILDSVIYYALHRGDFNHKEFFNKTCSFREALGQIILLIFIL